MICNDHRRCRPHYARLNPVLSNNDDISQTTVILCFRWSQKIFGKQRKCYTKGVKKESSADKIISTRFL